MRNKIFLLVLGLFALFCVCGCEKDEPLVHVPEEEGVYDREEVPEPVEPEPIVRVFTVDSGDSFLGILNENGIDQKLSYEIIKQSKAIFNLANIRPGHDITLVFAPDNSVLIEIRYEISYLDSLVVKLQDDNIVAEKKKIERILPPDYKGELNRMDVMVKKGDRLYDLLHENGVCDYQIDALSKSSKKIFNLSDIVPGHSLSVWLTSEKPVRVGRLTYEIDDLKSLEIVPVEGAFTADVHTLDVDVHYERAEGTIESSLYVSATSAGVSPEIVMGLTDIFAWDINFFTDIRPGDAYSVLYEKYYVKDEFKGYGRVLAAKFINQGSEHVAVYYEEGSGSRGYYDADGKPIRKLFLKAPLNYRRISSGFTYHRMHPVFHVDRPHLGVDYAAPTGTPVVALGDGKIFFKGWSNGFGNSIRIKHRGGYITYYGHFSRFARGMKSGKRVSQGQVIGYVGQTGVATGPHLDFRVKYKGKFINPLKLKPVTGPKLSGRELENFRTVSSKRLVMLEDTSLNMEPKLSNK